MKYYKIKMVDNQYVINHLQIFKFNELCDVLGIPIAPKLAH